MVVEELDGGEDVFGGFVEEGFFGEGAGCDDPCDVPLDEAFGLCGVFDLVADGDAVSGGDESAEI